VAAEIEQIANEQGIAKKLDELDELVASQPLINGKRM
jgi:hypothetical protein